MLFDTGGNKDIYTLSSLLCVTVRTHLAVRVHKTKTVF